MPDSIGNPPRQANHGAAHPPGHGRAVDLEHGREHRDRQAVPSRPSCQACGSRPGIGVRFVRDDRNGGRYLDALVRSQDAQECPRCYGWHFGHVRPVRFVHGAAGRLEGRDPLRDNGGQVVKSPLEVLPQSPG